MTLPDQYHAAYRALTDALRSDLLWDAHLSDHSAKWAGRALSAVLLLTGTAPARYVEPWSDQDTQALGALVFTDELLIAVEVGPLVEREHEVSVTAVPLVVDSLEVSADTTPWDNTFGSAPPWPGNLTATVGIPGREPITVPMRPPDYTGREAVERLVTFLAARLRSTAANTTAPPAD